MKTKAKVRLLLIIILTLTILICTAASDSVFFVRTQLDYDDTSYIEGDKYSLYFNKDGGSIRIVEITYGIENAGNNLARIEVQVSHRINYDMDSLDLVFELLNQPSAVVLENMDSYSPEPQLTIATGDYPYVKYSFPDPKGSEGSVYETSYLSFLLDLSDMDSSVTDKLILNVSFSIHEQSVFKVVKYANQTAVQLIIPYSS